jgi:hypothetical protein
VLFRAINGLYTTAVRIAHAVVQLPDPAEYVGTGGANRGSLDEEGVAYSSRIEA